RIATLDDEVTLAPRSAEASPRIGTPPVGGGKFTGRHEGRKDLRCSGPCLFWSFLCFSVPSCEFSGDSSARHPRHRFQCTVACSGFSLHVAATAGAGFN